MHPREFRTCFVAVSLATRAELSAAVLAPRALVDKPVTQLMSSPKMDSARRHRVFVVCFHMVDRLIVRARPAIRNYFHLHERPRKLSWRSGHYYIAITRQCRHVSVRVLITD